MSTKPGITFVPTFNNLKNASDVFTQLDQLCSEREGWESNEYKTSTARLYGLLAAVYSVYESAFVQGKDDDRRTIRQQLVGKLNAIGINVRKSADTLGLLVRYVFQADRRRVMSYKYAILAAKSHDVDPDELEDWLVDQGGLEEVVRKVSFSQKTLDRRTALRTAINEIQETIFERINAPIATVKVPVVTAKSRVVMLAEPCGEGEFKILYVFDSPSDGVQNSLIRKAATTKAEVAVELRSAKAEVTSFINFNQIARPEALVDA